jgi:tetratricopeptide (TPR) repeat protein
MMGQLREGAPVLMRGEIVSGQAIAGPLTVELSGNGAVPAAAATVNPDNTFEFRSATLGMHQLRVIGPNGQVLYEENINFTNPAATISIRLPDSPQNANRSGGSVVSLQQLRHKVPPTARKAFDKGEQAVAKGDLPGARSAFQEAVTIDPEFADAYNELGGVESGLKHLPEAAEQFQKAIDLVPEHPMALPNLSITLAKMQRMHEAGQVAKRALQVAPSDGRMHYILAASLLAEEGTFEQIIAEFERAADTVRAAHVIVAELLAREGHSEEAIRHLETFLATAPPDDSLRAKAEARLAALRP